MPYGLLDFFVRTTAMIAMITIAVMIASTITAVLPSDWRRGATGSGTPCGQLTLGRSVPPLEGGGVDIVATLTGSTTMGGPERSVGPPAHSGMAQPRFSAQHSAWWVAAHT